MSFRRRLRMEEGTAFRGSDDEDLGGGLSGARLMA